MRTRKVASKDLGDTKLLIEREDSLVKVEVNECDAWTVNVFGAGSPDVKLSDRSDCSPSAVRGRRKPCCHAQLHLRDHPIDRHRVAASPLGRPAGRPADDCEALGVDEKR